MPINCTYLSKVAVNSAVTELLTYVKSSVKFLTH